MHTQLRFAQCAVTFGVEKVYKRHSAILQLSVAVNVSFISTIFDFFQSSSSNMGKVREKRYPKLIAMSRLGYNGSWIINNNK